MARNKKQAPCDFCHSQINISKKSNYMKCVNCEAKIHYNCRSKIKLAPNGEYYCKDHQYLAPTNTRRVAAINVERVNEIIQGLSALNENVDDVNAQKSLSNTMNLLKEMLPGLIEESEVIKPTESQSKKVEKIRLDRYPNVPNARIPPPPLAPNCKKCNLSVVGPFFKCRACLCFWHDSCVINENRNLHIEGYWACDLCKNRYDEHQYLMNYGGKDQNVIQRKHDEQAMMYANMRLDDPYFNQPRLSNFPLVRNDGLVLPESNAVHVNKSSILQMPERKDEHLSGSKIGEAIAKAIAEALKAQGVMSLIENNTHSNSNNVQNNNTPVAQSTPTNHEKLLPKVVRVEEEQLPVNPVNIVANENDSAAIEKIVEASILKFMNQHKLSSSRVNEPERGKQIEVSSSENLTNAIDIEKIIQSSITKYLSPPEDLNRKVAEMQLKESQKRAHYKLPKVKTVGYEWKIFFNAFQQSKDLFSANENIVRLQEALECDEIKKLGGINLFTEATYQETVMELDKRIGKPEKLLINQKQKLINTTKLRNHERKEVINFIEDVKQYAILVDKLGSIGDKTDTALIGKLTLILPDVMMSSWSSEYARMKEENEQVYIQDMAKWLDKKIAGYEVNQFFQDINSYGEIKQKFQRSNTQGKSSWKGKNQNVTFSQRTNEPESSKFNDSSSQSNPNESPANYCWFHERTGHSSLTCYSLMEKTGREVCELARAKKICVICSRKAHVKCPYMQKLTCVIPDCKFRHAMIFCHKRRCQNASNFNRDSRRFYKPRNSNNESDQTTEIVQATNLEDVASTSTSNINASHQNAGNSQTLPIPVSQNSLNALNSGFHRVNTDSSNLNMSVWGNRSNNMQMMCQESEMTACQKSLGTSSTLVSVIPFVLTHGEKSLTAAFLLDSGSTSSLIDEDYAEFLDLNGPSKEIQLNWSGGAKREDSNSKIVKAYATGLHKEARTYEIFFRTVKNLGMPNQYFDSIEMKNKFPHLRNLDLITYSKVIGIIGTDQSWFFKQLKCITSAHKLNTSPVAFLTPLGYCVIGSGCPLPLLYQHLMETSCESNFSHTAIKMSESEEEELLKMQENVLGLDYLLPPENDRNVDADEKSLQILRNTTRKLSDLNRYEVGLLWKNSIPTLPTYDSLLLAIRRSRILFNHALRIGKLEEIEAQLKNLLVKEYAKKLSPTEIRQTKPNTFYLPIFISKQKEKRLRLIWDAAAKVNGQSLNDFLYPGPNLYADLTSLLMQFREGKYFVKADVEEMFHRIGIREEDRCSMRFVFTDSKTRELIHYEMQRMIFGAVCAPASSQFIKNKIADEYEKICPHAADAVRNNMYVDDFIKSFNDVTLGSEIIFHARKMLKDSGLNLVKMYANHPQILSQIKESMETNEIENEKIFIKTNVEKLLGYEFNYDNDSMKLADLKKKLPSDLINGTKIPTKKELLRCLMSIYDPLGLFMFFTSKVKLIYHWMCKDKLDWNELMSSKQLPYWKKVLEWFPTIFKIHIPRCYSSSIELAMKFQLIIFGDAGKESLCSVAYIRVLGENNEQLNVKIIGSKSYIVPIKQKRSIPELELDIAAKNVKYKNSIIKNHSIKFDEIIFATDSSCVLSWIKNGANKSTIYTQNRLNKIHAHSKKDEWIWIPTEYQPADFGTKFESLPELIYENDWFNPKIFLLPEDTWRTMASNIPESNHQVHCICQVHLEEEERNQLIKMFSNWNKLLSLTEMLMKWKLFRRNSSNGINEEGIRELAETVLFRIAQNECLSKEIKQLNTKNCLERSNKLAKFLPFIDDNKVMRVTTRLASSNNYHKDKIYPIVLPKEHNITKLIIMSYHNTNHHSHYKTVVTNLMQRFFIHNIVWVVKKTVRESCFICKRRNAKPDQPRMGDIPGYRLASYNYPFTYSIMDVCGPFHIRVNRRTEKRWLLVISCLTTRAIHMEVLHTMTANSCLLAMNNWINLRGAPKRIVSDNGSNFIGGRNLLKQYHERWNAELFKKGVITVGIEWDFQPAKASHMSGSVERMVGLVKEVLKKFHESLNQKILVPDDETFKSMICEIIGMLNNRPLTMLPIENTTNCFLTPNHFLMLRSNFQSAPSSTKFEKSTLKEWEDVKSMINVLWGHFNKAYVSELLYREKWIDYKKPLNTGDIVVVPDPTVNSLWRLGVIIKAEKGSADQVRKLTIRLGKRSLINEKNRESKSKMLYAYRKETFTIITRPACAVAPLNLLSLQFSDEK